MAEPWMKFYTSDWRADPRLKMCSPGARGMWIEMICLMHEASPYGHLLIHGQTPNVAQLASLTGIQAAELPDLIAELERHGVFSRTREGVIYSRKLVRMASRSAKAQKNGKKGGNPSLCKETEKIHSLNLEDNGHDKPQIPDTRYQILPFAHPQPDRFEEFWESYPHRGGTKKGRKPAFEKYRAAVKRGVPEQTIIDGAKRSVADRSVRDGYARDPAAWLHQEGWTDEIAAQGPVSAQSSPDRSARLAKYEKIAGRNHMTTPQGQSE